MQRVHCRVIDEDEKGRYEQGKETYHRNEEKRGRKRNEERGNGGGERTGG